MAAVQRLNHAALMVLDAATREAEVCRVGKEKDPEISMVFSQLGSTTLRHICEIITCQHPCPIIVRDDDDCGVREAAVEALGHCVASVEASEVCSIISYSACECVGSHNIF